jgi:hypothetical protein
LSASRSYVRKFGSLPPLLRTQASERFSCEFLLFACRLPRFQYAGLSFASRSIIRSGRILSLPFKSLPHCFTLLSTYSKDRRKLQPKPRLLFSSSSYRAALCSWHRRYLAVVWCRLVPSTLPTPPPRAAQWRTNTCFIERCMPSTSTQGYRRCPRP